MTDRNDIAQFYISTDEDLRFRLTFVNRSFTGRTPAIIIRERSSNELKTTLTAPLRLTIGDSGAIPGFPGSETLVDNDITATLPKSLMGSWATGDYEADLLDLTVGSATRVCPVRFTYDQPGRLVTGVEGNQAVIRITDENQAIVTAVGGVGVPGPANTLIAGTIEMLAPDEDPEIEVTGDPPVQTINLKIPRGFKGDQGLTGEIVSVEAVSGAAGTEASVVNEGSSTAAELVFTIPIGDQGYHGWAPVLAIVSDGARRVQMVVDWTGGEGTKPTLTGYVGPSGIVPSIGDGQDIRGTPGASVGPGSIDTPELADGAVTEVKVDTAFLLTILRDTDLAELVPQTSPTGAADIPTGTTAERPASPNTGYIRFNSTTGEYEGYNGTGWAPLGGGGAKRGDTPPTTNVRDGDLWFSEAYGALFIYLIDSGESDGQWISTVPIVDPSLFMLKGDNFSGIGNVSTALDNLGFSALGKTLRAIADAAAGRSALNAAPLPQGASGVGQLVVIAGAANTAVTLPSGGTWAFWAYASNISSGTVVNGAQIGVTAGGTLILAAFGANISWYGWAWRIA